MTEPGAPAHEKVLVWQTAHAFVLAVYRYTASLPPAERFGLVSQARRAAVSVPANFAEGFGRTSIAEKARFYGIALASLDECRYELRLAEDLGYGSSASIRLEAAVVSRMLQAYRREMLKRAKE